jgi:phosphoribosylaminoimidazole carboxylase PurE protein
MASATVGILMGSDSDLPVMRGAADVLESYGISWELRVLSAHRVPSHVAEYAAEAGSRGVKVIIAGAGMAAHLAGVVAAHTSLPVIGVPLLAERSGLGGADSLYATVQMPPGVPVATVGIGAAKNAGHLAARILALTDEGIADAVDAHRRRQADEVLAKDARLSELGPDRYLGERG